MIIADPYRTKPKSNNFQENSPFCENCVNIHANLKNLITHNSGMGNVKTKQELMMKTTTLFYI